MPLEMISERDFPQFTELEALHDFLKCFKKHAPRSCTAKNGSPLACQVQGTWTPPHPLKFPPIWVGQTTMGMEPWWTF